MRISKKYYTKKCNFLFGLGYIYIVNWYTLIHTLLTWRETHQFYFKYTITAVFLPVAENVRLFSSNFFSFFFFSVTCMSASAFYWVKSLIGIFSWFPPIFMNKPLPPTFRFWTCQLTWSVTLRTCIQTCNITIVIYGYARSLTNHISDTNTSDLSPWLHIDCIVT